MDDVVVIKVQALDWTCGECAFFDIMVKENAAVSVDWDDGCTSRLTGKGDWQRVEHAYSVSRKKTEDVFRIAVKAEGEGTVIGLRNGSIDMKTMEIDLNRCTAIRYLAAPYLAALDIRNCRSLQELDITGGEFEHIDLTQNVALETLQCDFSLLARLDLSACKRLKRFSCRSCRKLSHIGLANDSILETFTYNAETPVKEKCLRHLERTINRNNGKMINESHEIEV